MSFTYDSVALERILHDDQSLLVAREHSSVHNEIVRELTEENSHWPDWFTMPGLKTKEIYYRNEGFGYSSNLYCLWRSKELVYFVSRRDG